MQSHCPPASLLATGAARGKAPDVSPDINSSSLWLGFGEAVLCQRTVHGEGSEAGAGCSCLEHVGWHMPGWCNRRGCIALQIPQGDERLRPWLGHCCPDKATYDSCETTVVVGGLLGVSVSKSVLRPHLVVHWLLSGTHLRPVLLRGGWRHGARVAA